MRMPTTVTGTGHPPPNYCPFLFPPLLEPGKQLSFAPFHSEGFSGGKCGLWHLTDMGSNSASVAHVDASGTREELVVPECLHVLGIVLSEPSH